MIIELQDLFFIAIIAGAAGYWWKAREIKELAYQKCRNHCEKMHVELLDDSLVLNAVKLKSPSGKWGLNKHFIFEFTTTGEYRYQGKIIMSGKQAIEIYLAPHHLD